MREPGGVIIVSRQARLASFATPADWVGCKWSLLPKTGFQALYTLGKYSSHHIKGCSVLFVYVDLWPLHVCLAQACLFLALAMPQITQGTDQRAFPTRGSHVYYQCHQRDCLCLPQGINDVQIQGPDMIKACYKSLCLSFHRISLWWLVANRSQSTHFVCIKSL